MGRERSTLYLYHVPCPDVQAQGFELDQLMKHVKQYLTYVRCGLQIAPVYGVLRTVLSKVKQMPLAAVGS